MRISLKVEGLAKVRREIDRARKKLGLSAAEFSDEAAKVLRDTVARNAQPFGLGRKAQQKGERAVRRDLLKVFRLVPEGDRARRGVVSSTAEAKRIHRSRRGRAGRTIGGSKEKIIPSVFEAYAQSVMARVGMAKGSVTGGDDRRLKGRLAQWVTRWKSKGDARRRRKLGGAQWTFRAEAAHVATPRVLGERGVRRAMRMHERNLARVLKRKIERELRRTGRRVNRRG